MAVRSASSKPSSLLKTTVPPAPAASGISVLSSSRTVSKRLPGMENSEVSGLLKVAAEPATTATTATQAPMVSQWCEAHHRPSRYRGVWP